MKGRKMTNQELGQKGEIAAQNYLKNLEYNILARNFKCSYGEIDIIAKTKKELVFVEVKTRCSKQYGEAREAVDAIKKKHIKKAASYYIYKNGLENEFVRFDVMEVYLKNEKFYIKHIKNTLW